MANGDHLQELVMKRATQGIFQICLIQLGEDHLITRAFETALLLDDHDLMMRAVVLLENVEGAKQKVLWGE